MKWFEGHGRNDRWHYADMGDWSFVIASMAEDCHVIHAYRWNPMTEQFWALNMGPSPTLKAAKAKVARRYARIQAAGAKGEKS